MSVQSSTMANTLSASEVAMQVATDALQLHGGNGYVKESLVEKMFRDAKVLSIYEGTSQVLKNQIATTILMDAGRLKKGRPTSQTSADLSDMGQPVAVRGAGRVADGLEGERRN